MEVRVSRILSEYYSYTRKESEEYLRAGRVTVNGNVVGIGDKATIKDKVELDGVLIPLKGIFRLVEREQAGKAVGERYGNGKNEESHFRDESPKSRDLRKGRKNENKKPRGKNYMMFED